MRMAAIQMLIMAALLSTVAAVNMGDEQFANIVDGELYAFADQVIHVINPSNGSVVANITRDMNNTLLTGPTNNSRVWNDGVYLQKPLISGQFIFVNEGDTYENNGTAFTYTTVIDATSRAIVGRVRVGARATHVFAVNQTGTVWVKSDADGYFYVIDVRSKAPFQQTTTTVKGFDTVPGHGKLIVNEQLYPYAYGTNVAEATVTKYDVSNNTRIGAFNFTRSLTNSTCTGTHSGWYSRVNQHVYFECQNRGGVLEWNTRTDSLVAQHPVVGTIAATPADDLIFVTETADIHSTVLSPGANGQPSTIRTVLTINSQPGDPAFYANSTSSGPRPLTEQTAFFPTARNTNLNNIRVAGNGNVQLRSYYAKPTDCTYQDNGTVSTTSVASSTPQALRLAAGSNQTCGACAAGIADLDASQFNASLAGLRIYDVGSTEQTAILVSAGAVAPAASASTGANQCSFASPSRVAKRAGQYIATIADFPQPSVYFVLGNQPFLSSSEYFVRTARRPRKIVWAPKRISATG